jgi:hypothetical protein
VTERAGSALKLALMAGRQLRIAFDGVYGLDWNVIARLADDCGVETDEEWWEMLGVAEGALVLAMNPPKPPTGGAP